MFRVFYLLAVFALIFNTVRLPVFGISVSDAFIFAALGFWAIEAVRNNGRERWGIPVHPLWIPALLILLGGLLSSFGAASPGTSFSITVKMVFVLTLWVCMGILMVWHGDLRWVVWTLTISVFFTSAIAVADRFTGWNWGATISGRQGIFWNRSDGTVGHPVELGFVTSTALPIVFGLFLEEWQTRRRWWLLLLFGTAFAAILAANFLAGSVTGWAVTALTIGLLSLLFFVRASNRTKVAILLCAAVLVGAAVMYFSESTRLSEIQFLLEFNLGRASNLTGPDRVGLVEQALDAISANPLVGAGMDQVGTGGLERVDLVTTDVVHNVLVGGWLGGGLLVLIGILGCYLVGLLTALLAMRDGFHRDDWLVMGLAASVVGWMLFDQTQPHPYHRNTWMVLSLLFGLGYQIRFFVARTHLKAEPKGRFESVESR